MGAFSYPPSSGGGASSNSGGNGLIATGQVSNYTAVAGDLVVCSSVGSSFTVTLPAAPVSGDRVGVFKASSSATNVTIGRNGKNIDGAASDLTITPTYTLRVLQYDGTQWLTVAADGQSILASDYTITSSNAWKDTGLSVTLPITGIYRFYYNVRTFISISGGTLGFILCRLTNNAGAVTLDGGGSERFNLIVDTALNGQNVQLQSAFSFQAYCVAGTIVYLGAFRNAVGGSPSWAGSNISSDSNGYTTLGYELLP